MIDTLVFDEGQITNPLQGSHPLWGGCCHSLTGNAGRTVVIIREMEENQMPDKVVINETTYTKEDADELMKLAHEFLDGNDSPEAKKLMETIKSNMDRLFYHV